MRNLTPKEELEEELIDLIIAYEDIPKGTPYAEELYEELIRIEGRLRNGDIPKGTPYAEELYEELIRMEGRVRNAEALAAVCRGSA
jgi:hypothetical protein